MTDYRFKKTDVVVVATDGEEFPFWRDLLVSNSQAMDKIFQHNMMERTENRVRMDGTMDQVHQFLSVLHPVGPDSVTKENVYNVLKMAHCYGCDSLVQMCLNTLEGLHLESKTVDDLVTQIIQLRYWISFFKEDKEMHDTLSKILQNPLTAIINSTDLDLNDESLMRLTRQDLSILFMGVYALRKKDAEKVTIVRTAPISPKRALRIRQAESDIRVMRGW